MLATAAHPQAYFVAERFEFGSDGSVAGLTGEFTLRGSGQALRLRAQRFRCYTSPLLLREVCGGDFEGEFNRRQDGNYNGGFNRYCTHMEEVRSKMEKNFTFTKK